MFWCDEDFCIPRIKIEAQIIKRLAIMNIYLGEQVYPNFIAYSINNLWLGFAKIYLTNSRDCLDLLEGNCHIFE